MKPEKKGITRNVFFLGLVSFFTDLSSEMIFPLLPLFVKTVLWAGTVAETSRGMTHESGRSLQSAAPSLQSPLRSGGGRQEERSR